MSVARQTRTGRPKRRPHPLTDSERTQELERRRARAHEELFDIRLVPQSAFVHLDIVNPLRGSRYEVLMPGYPDLSTGVCTCSDFAQRDLGTCKHLEAVRLWLPDHPGEIGASGQADPSSATRTAGVWEEIDRRISALREDGHPPSQRLRRPGRALVNINER
jgi:hypothetical protein